MRRSKLLSAATLAAGAAFALSACGGSGGEANNTAMNAAQSGFGNAADPSAVETMGNGAEAVDLGANAMGGNAAGAGDAGNGSGTATGNGGGDAGGNAAGGTSNGM